MDRNIPEVERLLNNGANINFVLKNYDTPLSVAIESKNIELLNILLGYGVDLYINFRSYNNMLFFAVEHIYAGHSPDEVSTRAEIVKKLCTEDPRLLNTRNVEGETPLERSILNSYPEITKVLLECGSQITDTAIQYAKRYYLPKKTMDEFLQERRRKRNVKLMRPILRKAGLGEPESNIISDEFFSKKEAEIPEKIYQRPGLPEAEIPDNLLLDDDDNEGGGGNAGGSKSRKRRKPHKVKKSRKRRKTL
jgi:hypothetical protein